MPDDTDDTADPIRASVAITNLKGLHARASAKFVKTASGFDAHIHVIKDEARVDAQSIMGLLMLAAGIGSSIDIEAEGPEAQAAVDALVALVTDRFGEEV